MLFTLATLAARDPLRHQKSIISQACAQDHKNQNTAPKAFKIHKKTTADGFLYYCNTSIPCENNGFLGSKRENVTSEIDNKNDLETSPKTN